MPLTKVSSSKLLVFKPDNFDPAKKYPTLIFLHGIGERGDGSDPGLESLYEFVNSEWNNIVSNANKYGFLIVAPQLDSAKGDWDILTIDNGINYAKANLPIDANKFYISGVSLGGGGVWKYLSSAVTNASKFAAAVVCCGVPTWSNLANIANGKVGVWAFHAKDDGIVGYGSTVSAVDGINAANPVVPAKKTIYPEGNHYIWGRVYAEATPGIEGESVNVWQWMLLNSVLSPVAVPKGTPTTTTTTNNSNMKAPTTNAGVDQTTGGTSVYLQGSGSYVQGGGTIDKYLWEQVSGPNTATIKMISTTNAEVSGMIPGTYKFKLTTTNSAGSTSDEVQVIVASAGGVVPTTPTKKLIATIKIYDDGSIEKV